jgi:hypothetical protein
VNCSGGTKADAEKRERELRRALDTGTFVDAKAGTVAEFMLRWLESVKEKKSERTYVRYEQMVRNQIIADLGHVKLADLRPLHIDAAEAKWAVIGNRKTTKPGPLSPQSVLHLHRCLHTAMERAVRWRLLAVNPVDGVDEPYVPKREAGFLVPDEAVRLLDAIRGSAFELPLLVGLHGRPAPVRVPGAAVGALRQREPRAAHRAGGAVESRLHRSESGLAAGARACGSLAASASAQFTPSTHGCVDHNSS